MQWDIINIQLYYNCWPEHLCYARCSQSLLCLRLVGDCVWCALGISSCLSWCCRVLCRCLYSWTQISVSTMELSHAGQRHSDSLRFVHCDPYFFSFFSSSIVGIASGPTRPLSLPMPHTMFFSFFIPSLLRSWILHLILFLLLHTSLLWTIM